MKDRIDCDEDGLDDVFLAAVSVHIERMDDDRIWLAVNRADGSRYVFNFWSKKRIRWEMEVEQS